MTAFLIEFDKVAEKSVITRFDDAREALEALSQRERLKSSDEEVVVLFARSEEQLRKTHPRYFMPASEIARYSLAG
ncbi:MAG: hypothetical protein WD557_17375 [Dehalococcoidia bacterium]